MKRVVLDTNIFVSMAMGGQVGKINDKWRAGKFILVVSGDKHLLDLKEFKSIPIITAREFIEILETA